MDTQPSHPSAPASPTLLYLWDNRTLFLGNSVLPMRNSTIASHTLTVCFQGEFRVKYPGREEIRTRSMLVEAGHSLNLDYVMDVNLVVGAVYLDPVGQDFPVLTSLMTQVTDDLYIDHPDEDTLISELIAMRNAQLDSRSAKEKLETLIIPADFRGKTLKVIDPRIAETVQTIKDTVAENLSVDELAQRVHLSPSRLCKLFSAELGIPIRRYRLWRRLFNCTIAVANGKTFFEAGLESGFSSPAHCSKTYLTLTGTLPSQTFAASEFFKVICPEPEPLETA